MPSLPLTRKLRKEGSDIKMTYQNLKYYVRFATKETRLVDFVEAIKLITEMGEHLRESKNA